MNQQPSREAPLIREKRSLMLLLEDQATKKISGIHLDGSVRIFRVTSSQATQ
jgi:hypothetical protein